MTKKKPAPTPSDCPRCAELTEQLRQARASRDQALLELATERERVNALRLGFAGRFHVDEHPADRAE